MAKQVFDAGYDVTLPEVAIVIGGRERDLAFDMAALSRVERETGFNLLRDVFEATNAQQVAVLLWAALLHDDPELSLAEVVGWINPANAVGVLKVVRAAWLGSIPEPGSAVESSVGEAEAPASTGA